MPLSCPGMAATGGSRTVTGPRSTSWSSRDPALAALLVAAFVILRSAGMGSPVPEVWAALASLVALFSPLAGFLAAVALGPFDDWSVLGTEAGGRAVLVGALVNPWPFGRWRDFPNGGEHAAPWRNCLRCGRRPALLSLRQRSCSSERASA